MYDNNVTILNVVKRFTRVGRQVLKIICDNIIYCRAISGSRKNAQFDFRCSRLRVIVADDDEHDESL